MLGKHRNKRIIQFSHLSIFSPEIPWIPPRRLYGAQCLLHEERPNASTSSRSADKRKPYPMFSHAQNPV